MTQPQTSSPASNDAVALPSARSAGVLRPLALLAGGAGCLVLGWLGAWAGLAGVLAAALLLPRLLPSGRSAGVAGATEVATPRVSGGRVGAEVMVAQVVPVWSKQLDATRVSAAQGLEQLLGSFAEMAGALETLSSSLDNFTPTVDSGAVEGTLAQQSPALAALLAPSQRAFDQRDAAVALLTRCADQLAEMRQIGKSARDIGRHTRLVAFNASIEANRSGGGDSGGSAVAEETRMLAGRMAEVGEQIDRLVLQLDRTLGADRLSAEIADTAPEELRLEVGLRAREALSALLTGLGGAVHGSGEIKNATQTLRQQVEALFIHFQFGDRLSQMLSIVGDDMNNFARWVDANPYATQNDAAEWLANLEASYTMEEQRSQHHGNVHIDRGSEVEFF